MNVVAKKDTSCPFEDAPREYITDSVIVDVPNTSYYRRRVADGSLVLKTIIEQPLKTNKKGSK
jgi:hypothetical protein